MNRIIFTFLVSAVATWVTAQAPPGYEALNNSSDWWVKTELVGETKAYSVWIESGELKSAILTFPWDNPGGDVPQANNSTPYSINVWSKADGVVKFKFKWRHGTNPAPPNELRLRMWADVSVSSSTPSYTASVDSGLGLPIVNGRGYGLRSDGLVLRKVKINAGEGEMEITQKAHVTVNEPGATCIAQAPSVSKQWDNRDVTITSIFGGWPSSKQVAGNTVSTFVHSQDAWPYFPFREAKQFQWQTSIAAPAALLTPYDVTDEAEWHIGLWTGYHVVANGAQASAYPKTFAGATLVGNVVGDAVGDSYYWEVASNHWRSSDPIGPFESPKQGTYNGVPIDAMAIDTAYALPESFKAIDGPQLIAILRDAGQADSATFSWTWAEDGMVATSKRTIILHKNREPAGQDDSPSWFELRVGQAYAGQLLDFDDVVSVPDIEGFVDYGVQECLVGNIGIRLEGLGAVMSASGPMVGGVLAGLGIVSSGTALVGFAAAETLGAIISIIPIGSDSFTFHRDTLNNNQVDAVEIDGDGVDLDTNGDGNIDTYGVKFANYSNPALLAALKAKVSSEIQFYYWKVAARKTAQVKYKVFDLWGHQGFRGQAVFPEEKELALTAAYYRMTLKRVVGP